MAEDIIKGKIVFEGGGALGKAGTSVAGAGPGGGGGGGLMTQAAGEAIGHKIAAGNKEGLKAAKPFYKSAIGKLGIIGAAVSILAKASPQLKATFSVVWKSLMLILRPIGDVISMFLRPLAIGLIRFLIPILQKWNKFKGSDVGEAVGKVAGGALTGAGIGATIGAGIGAFGGPGGMLAGAGAGAAAGAIVGAIIGLLPTIAKAFGPVVEAIGETFGKMWESVKEIWSGLVSWFDENVYLPLLGLFGPLIDWFNENIVEPLKIAWGIVAGFVHEHVIEPIKAAWGKIVEWFDKFIIEPIKKAWETITTWFMTNVIDPITTLWQTLVDKIAGIFDGLWEKITSWWGWLRALGRARREKSAQTGAYVTDDGLYRLHQGETVVPAHMSGMTNQFMPNITINANINSEMDLQALANRLSGLMMESLQRRNSYTFT